jgi:hypothetical protein
MSQHVTDEDEPPAHHRQFSPDAGTGGKCLAREPDAVMPGPQPPVRASRAGQKKENGFLKDEVYTVRRDNLLHIISENYYYKTEPYYQILRHEIEGTPVAPASAAVLDAYVIPICLEKAGKAGIPVAEWGISHSYVPTPSIVYGLNYFATSSEFTIVTDPERAKSVVKHITNRGKYPFCYQRFPDGASVVSITSIFGKTADPDSPYTDNASRLYGLFRIPLVNMVFIATSGGHLLSALTPTRYSSLSQPERALLQAYINNQAFL